MTQSANGVWVFGYGSLVQRESAEATLGHALAVAPVKATLIGWRRGWMVGSSRESHPERDLRWPDGTRFEGVSVALGVERADDTVNGAIFPVTDADLEHLDRRERNYHRVDVTDAVDCPTLRPGRVVTYIPRREALDRLRAAEESGRVIVVRHAYVLPTLAAFAALGPSELGEFLRTTAPWPGAWQDLHLPVLSPPMRSPNR
jgi:cation transport regulator ChaC